MKNAGLVKSKQNALLCFKDKSNKSNLKVSVKNF